MKAGTKNITFHMVNHVEAKYARSISAPQQFHITKKNKNKFDLDGSLIFEKEIRGVFNNDRDYSLEAEFDDFDKLLRKTKTKGRSQSPNKEKDPDQATKNGDLDIMDYSRDDGFMDIDRPNDSPKVKPKSDQKIMSGKSNNSRIAMGDRQIQTSKGIAVDHSRGGPFGTTNQKTSGTKQEIAGGGFGGDSNSGKKKDTPRLWARHASNLMANKLGGNAKS